MASKTNFQHKTLMVWAPDQAPGCETLETRSLHQPPRYLYKPWKWRSWTPGPNDEPSQVPSYQQPHTFLCPHPPGNCTHVCSECNTICNPRNHLPVQSMRRQTQTVQQSTPPYQTQILEVVPKCFREILADNEYAYDNVKVYDLINHFATTYGHVTWAALNANFWALYGNWDPETCFSSLLSHHWQIQQFAANDDPISDHTLLMKGLEAVSKTGHHWCWHVWLTPICSTNIQWLQNNICAGWHALLY